MIAIVDYGAGNLRSVQNALARIGAPACVVSDPQALMDASKLILPGVGHFGPMMRALDQLRLREALVRRVADGIPLLGICLGMQALYAGSEEAPGAAGLGLLPGVARRFGPSLRVPHMGWNSVETVGPSRLLPDAGASPYYYFANSYYAPRGPDTSGVCAYGESFAAAVERGNVCGVQFHPEKSGAAGLQLLRRFAELGPC